MLRGAANWLLKSPLGRQMSKSTRAEFMRGSVIRPATEKDHKKIVKGIHKYLPTKDKPESPNKRKKASLSKNELEQREQELKNHCAGDAYSNMVLAIDSFKKGKETSKFGGSGGLLSSAKEVLDWTITKPEFMPGDEPYALVCDLFVEEFARRLGKGTEIVGTLVRHAAAKEVKVLYAVVDAKKVGAKKCFTKNGFQEISETDGNGNVLLGKRV